MAKAPARGKRVVPLTTLPYDVADALLTPREMAGYLDAAFLEDPDDGAAFAHALGDVCRATGMTEVSRRTGLGRESLYKSLHEDGNPGFATILKVLAAVGLQLRVTER